MSERQESGRATILYRVFDAQDRLLYVGIAYSIFLRLAQHNDSAGWAHHAVKITLERFSGREAAVAAESEAIRTEDPVWNSTGRPVRRYLQWMAAYPNNPDDIDVDALIERVNNRLTSSKAGSTGEDPS